MANKLNNKEDERMNRATDESWILCVHSVWNLSIRFVCSYTSLIFTKQLIIEYVGGSSSFSFLNLLGCSQWRNRWRGGQGEISADLPGKERQGNVGKWSRKERKWKTRMVENWKWKEENLEWGDEEWTFFFFFFFFFFLLFTFQNHWNLFWLYQNENFPRGKSISHREKNLIDTYLTFRVK